jgi:hypothetical protein
MKIKKITRNWTNFLLETQRPGPGHQQTTYEKKNEVIKMDGWGNARYDATGESGGVVEEQFTGDSWWKMFREMEQEWIASVLDCCTRGIEDQDGKKIMDAHGERPAWESCMEQFADSGAVGAVERTGPDTRGGQSELIGPEEMKVVDWKKFEELESKWCEKSVAESKSEDLKSKHKEKTGIVKRKGEKDILLGGESTSRSKRVRIKRKSGKNEY